MVEAMRLLNEREMEPEELSFSAVHLADLIELVEKKEITGTVAKEVFELIFSEDIDPKSYVEKNGLKTVKDENKLKEIIKAVIEKNPQSVADYKSGKKKAIGYLVGQVMKEMKGKADPSSVNDILFNELEEI